MSTQSGAFSLSRVRAASKLDKRKTKSVDKKLAELYKTLHKQTRALNSREFACKADAEKELELFKKNFANEFYL